MSIKDTIRQTKTFIKDGAEKVVQHHSKEHRREVSQKITDKLHLQKVVDKARGASDKVKEQAGSKVASQAKLTERSLLKLDPEAHKKLLSDDPSVWSSALSGKSIEQIGKYLDRAAEAENLKWPTKKDKDLSYNLKTVFQSGGNPYEFALEKIAEVTPSKKAAGRGIEVSTPNVATLEKLAHLYCTALMNGLDSGPKAAKKTFLERVQRNSKTDVAVLGKRLEVLGKTLQHKAVRLPSSAVHGAANAVVGAPVVGGGAALVASSLAVLIASHGLLALPALIGLVAMYPAGLATMAGGAALMAPKRNKKQETADARPPSYSETDTSDGTDFDDKRSISSFNSLTKS